MSGARLPIVYAAAARSELDEIWEWNERAYSRTRAANYIDFLTRQIDTLSSDPLRGPVVTTRLDMRYLSLKFRSGGHGHVAVYRIVSGVIHILHIFHTAQDWQASLADEPPA